jgi:hypothetical protein
MSNGGDEELDLEGWFSSIDLSLGVIGNVRLLLWRPNLYVKVEVF